MSRHWMLGIILLLTGQVIALPVTKKILVDGIWRTALVYPGKSAQQTPSPLVLVFHGFNGNANGMAKIAKIQELWPEATVVYPQGLRVYSRRLRRMVPAWQTSAGLNNDRDLHFIDALLAELHKAYQVDDWRIYATGSSNGAMFCYLLFIMRPDAFAAFGIVAGSAEEIQNATRPRPILIIHGSKDESVKLESALKARDFIRCLNGCGDETTPWDTGYLSYEPCATGQPVIWHQHPEGHIWPQDASAHIVRFFKEQTRPD